MTANRLRSTLLPRSLVVGAFISGCASSHTLDPRVNAPATGSEQPPATPAAAITPPITPDDSADRAHSRTHPTAVADHDVSKLLASFDASNKKNTEASPTSGSPDPASTGSQAVPFIYAERRASEALDHLAGVVVLRHEKRGEVITLLCDKLVEAGQWALTSSGKFALDEIVPGLRDLDGHKILIEAHTDSLGRSAVNDALSLQRAEAVRDYLASRGVPADRMRADGLGARRPVAGNATPGGRAQNRRIEIVIAR
jgi:outer membrane protein OmpA-like peptidoglycan-associated protein